MEFTVIERAKQRLSEVFGPARIVSPARLSLFRGVLTITFDDFPRSSWQMAGPVLAEHGAKATYFVSGQRVGGTFAGSQAMHAARLA